MPGVLELAGLGVSALGGLTSSQPEQKDGNLHLVNQGQSDLWKRMMQQYMGGAGDFGMGQNIKAGNSQLSQMMAGRGINPASGVGAGMFANMVGTAGAQANQSRLNFGMNLLRSPLQTAQAEGANWLPDSPSQGFGVDQQNENFRVSQGGTPDGVNPLFRRAIRMFGG